LLFEIRKTSVWRERHRRGASTHPAAPGVDANNATGIRDPRSAQPASAKKQLSAAEPAKCLKSLPAV